MQVRLTEELAKRIDAARELCSPSSSLNSFAELLLVEMANLLETEKGKRRVPNIIVQMDATRENQSASASFDAAINSTKVDQAVQMAFEHAVKSAKAKARQ